MAMRRTCWPGAEEDAGVGDGLPGLEAAGVGDDKVGRDGDAVDLREEFSVAGGVGDAEGEVVFAGGVNIDGVFKPLAGFGVTDVESAAGVGGGLDVDAFGGAIGAAEIGRIGIVIGDAFAAGVEVFSLDGGCAVGGDVERRAVEWLLRGGRRWWGAVGAGEEAAGNLSA